MTEHDTQSSFIAWCRLWAGVPGYAALRWVFAVPNGGARSKATAGKLKAEGVVAGVADVLWLTPGSVLAPDGLTDDAAYLCIEFKTARGRQSPEQRAFGEWVYAQGGHYVVCRSAGEAALAVCDYVEWRGDIRSDAGELARRSILEVA